MKLGVAHPMYWTHQVSSEHVHAWARGGTNDPSNLVAVCSQCQYAKNSRSLETLGWELLSAPTDAPTWHGLTDKMSALKAAAASVAPPAAASTAAVPLLAGPAWRYRSLSVPYRRRRAPRRSFGVNGRRPKA